uniref:Uncharacterized protein n=1 Tax=Ditylenchus dipsaci TaxID=166011 RepID=A0A915CPM7_9BILA
MGYFDKTSYHADSLSGRPIFWCPGGNGHLAYCPQPIDPEDYTYCCQFYYKGTDMPSCCKYPFHTGVVIAFLLSGFVIASLLIFMSCWCLPPCPLAKRLTDRREEGVLTGPYESSTLLDNNNNNS